MKKFKRYILSILTTIIVGISLYFNNPTLAFNDIAGNKHILRAVNENIYFYYLTIDDTSINKVNEK